jgi:tetratricopeptide (TPR) repeat protein
MSRIPALSLALAAAISIPMDASAAASARHFEWTTKSPEALKLLRELQGRIENFQFGPQNVELGKKLAAADPNFAMGIYYASVVEPDPDEAVKVYQRSRELAKKASEGERRFIEAMIHNRLNQGVDFRKSIEPLVEIGHDYPGERLVYMILGQLYNGDGKADLAAEAFRKAQAIGPRSARAEAFLAGHDLLKGRYAEARSQYESIEKSLPKGAVPFPIRFGITFSYLYEGNVDPALASLKTYLDEYKANGLDQQFPEVFIWNAMARINLENGRLQEAMADYEKGYESIPNSKLPEDQKQTWLGRLHHGKCRTLARMGKHEEAWKEAETVRTMIVNGGEAGRQFWPAYHYLAGYAKLESGDNAAALEHLLQADATNPFHTLLLARAYERLGRKDEAKKAYQTIVDSQAQGIELPLSYPEAKKKVSSL